MSGRRPGAAPFLVAGVLHAAVLAPLLAFTRLPEPVQFETVKIHLVSPPPAPVVETAPAVAQPQPEPEPAPPKPEPKPKAKTVEKKPPPEPPKKKTEARPKTEKPPETPKSQPQPEKTEQVADADAGGEGLDLITEGRELFPEYFANIVVQVSRYLRWTDQTRPQGEVYFEILPDGSVRNIRMNRPSGNPVFDFRVMGAVEAAGNRHAFGDLPKGFVGNVLPVQMTVEPPR